MHAAISLQEDLIFKMTDILIEFNIENSLSLNMFNKISAHQDHVQSHGCHDSKHSAYHTRNHVESIIMMLQKHNHHLDACVPRLDNYCVQEH